MIPRARLRAPLWRRVFAWLRARSIASRCAFCARYAESHPPHVIAMLHRAHTQVDRYLELVRSVHFEDRPIPFIRVRHGAPPLETCRECDAPATLEHGHNPPQTPARPFLKVGR